MRSKRGRSTTVGPVAAGSVTGNAAPDTPGYVPTAKNRPAKDDTYVMPDGSEHRWDGKCHEACENLR